MQFSKEEERHDFVAANLGTIEGVVWDYYHKTHRFPDTDIEEHTQDFAVHLMVEPRPLDRFNETLSLRAYLRTVFKFWYADKCKADPYISRRSRTDLDTATEVLGIDATELKREDEEEDALVHSRIREIEDSIIDRVTEAIERDLDTSHAECFAMLRFERQNYRIAQVLFISLHEVKAMRQTLEKYVRRLRINGKKLSEYWWEAISAIRANEEPASIYITFDGVPDEDPDRQNQIWDRITKRRKKSIGNFDYGDLGNNECTSRQIQQLLSTHLSGHQNPHHKISEWLRQGKLRLVRSNGREDSYRRKVYALDSVMALKNRLDKEKALRQHNETRAALAAGDPERAKLMANLGIPVMGTPRPAESRPSEPLVEE